MEAGVVKRLRLSFRFLIILYGQQVMRRQATELSLRVEIPVNNVRGQSCEAFAHEAVFSDSLEQCGRDILVKTFYRKLRLCTKILI
jgi:hypothetical protein